MANSATATINPAPTSRSSCDHKPQLGIFLAITRILKTECSLLFTDVQPHKYRDKYEASNLSP